MQHSTWEKMRKYLQDPIVQSRLHKQFQEVQQRVTIGINQSARIIHTTPARLRHWESLGLLGHSEDRRYSYHDLATLLIINELIQQTFNLATIAELLKKESLFIEKLVDEVIARDEDHGDHQLNILEGVTQAEKTLFWRIFVPRVMYLSLCLLFEQTLDSNVGLIIPVQGSYVDAEQLRIQTTANLPDLGEVLLGWNSRSHPFCTFLVSKVVFESEGQHQLIPLYWQLEKDATPKNSYLIVEGKLEYLLERVSANAHKVAGRLLKLLQETASSWKPFLHSAGDYMAYHSPDFRDQKFGERLLSEMAEMVILLGGLQKVQKQQRWQFCCILLPNDFQAPIREQSLVVQAQSRKSPHRINETSLLPGDQKSLSIKALQSGQIIYRPSITETETDIDWLELEGPISSAIAIPLEKQDGKPIGVMYIASNELGAFSNEDQLLLRMMGRMISEQILTYQAHSMLLENLSEVITNPQIVDRFFSEFHTESEFISELEKLLEQIKSEPEGEMRARESSRNNEKRPFHDLSFIAIDIDDLQVLSRKYGDRIIRNLVWAVGQRIREWINRTSSVPQDIQLYRMYADRFYLLLKDIPIEQTLKYASQLQMMLQKPNYRIEAVGVSPSQGNSFGGSFLSQISVSLGIMEYTYERLHEIQEKNRKTVDVRVRIIRSLNEALVLGKGVVGNNIAYWDPNKGSFMILGNAGILNSQDNSLLPKITQANQDIPENFIGKISDAISPRLLDQLRRELQ